MRRRQLRLPVPVHIITGALGSGKTTAIKELLNLKPATEVWALVGHSQLVLVAQTCPHPDMSKPP